MTDDANTQTASSTAEERMLDALDTLIRSVSSPDIVEAQAILLRRLALQGDVIDSRIPAPRNITEIGGYLNLLGTGQPKDAFMNQPEMRSQMVAGILGVVGPNPPLGWISRKPLLPMVSIENDRPDCAHQNLIPLTISIRSDFADPLRKVQKQIHDQGGFLPLTAGVRQLPLAGTGATPPDDVLPYLGRTIEIAPYIGILDPSMDPIALARHSGTLDPYQIVARVLKQGAPITIPSADWDVIKCDTTSCTTVPLAATQFIPVAPLLAVAGFYPVSPLPHPTNQSSWEWACFTNITGLVPGVTTLGSELNLVYSIYEIAGSVFSDRLTWVWNGAKFSPVNP